MSEQDAIVVGAGLFGRTLAKQLESLGMTVRIFDDDRPCAGSPPSGGLIKPGWFSGLGADYGRAFERLQELWGLEEMSFQVQAGPLAKTERLYRLPAERVLGWGTVERATVESVQPGSVKLRGRAGPVEARFVVVAAGFWSGELMTVPGLVGKAGCSFVWGDGWQVEQNFVRPWAPYKQVVAFNLPDGKSFWAGDGSALLHDHWTAEREAVSLARCASAAGAPPEEARRQFGIRPMIKGRKVAQLEERGRGLYLATGGGKTGAIGAGLCAAQLAERLA